MKLAAGFFDGVHAGHRRILEGADVALTFKNHPLAVLAPERAPRLLQPFRDRMASIRECGVGKIVPLEFTRSMSLTGPARFVEEVLRPLAAGGRLEVRCGGNWRFGRGGAGDAGFLRSAGIPVEVVPYSIYKGEVISSSRIRAALEGGFIEDANAMLAHLWTVAGRVASGKGLGRKIGYPTINVIPDALEIRLPRGVYAVEVDGARGIANWGVAPTAGELAWERPVLEVHMLGGWRARAPAGGEVRVAMLSFLRPEMKFSSMEALAEQIKADIVRAMAVSLHFQPSLP